MLENTPVRIVTQGAPRVNADDGGIIYRRGEDIALVLIDLGSKRCEVLLGIGADGEPPLVPISAVEGSLYLNDAHGRDEDTIIALPEFVGWDVWMAAVSKATLSVCLVKKDGEG